MLPGHELITLGGELVWDFFDPLLTRGLDLTTLLPLENHVLQLSSISLFSQETVFICQIILLSREIPAIHPESRDFTKGYP